MTYVDIDEFLEAAELHGKNIKTQVSSVTNNVDVEGNNIDAFSKPLSSPQTPTVLQEARLLKLMFLKLREWEPKKLLTKLLRVFKDHKYPSCTFDHIIMLGPYITRLELCFKRSSTRESVDVLFLSLMKCFPFFLTSFLQVLGECYIIIIGTWIAWNGIACFWQQKFS